MYVYTERVNLSEAWRPERIPKKMNESRVKTVASLFLFWKRFWYTETPRQKNDGKFMQARINFLDPFQM